MGNEFEVRFVYDNRTLGQFRKKLKVGQMVKLLMKEGDFVGAFKRTFVAEIKEVYPHIAIVEYPIRVKRAGVYEGYMRRESFTLKELMIWNMRVGETA